MKFFKYLLLIIPDINEIRFLLFNKIKKKSKNESGKNQNVLFSGMETDYYSLCLINFFRLDKLLPSGSITLYSPLLNFVKIDPKEKFISHLLIFFIKNFFIYLRNLKYQMLYKKNINNHLSLNNYNIFKEYKYISKSRNIVSKIKSKKNLKSLKINNINVGREIYDTYIRFSGNTTVDIENFLLVEIIAKILFIEKKLGLFIKKNKIKYYYSRQTAYIHHGFIINFLLKKKVKTYLTGSRNESIYRYTGKHYHYPYNFRKYKQFFNNLPNKKNKILKAKKLLLKRFRGSKPKQDLWIDNFQSYNPFHNSKVKKNNFNAKCIIYLHCFVDSPLMGGNVIFDDYSDWIIKTLDFFERKKLSKYVIIKPHPSAKPDSIRFEKDLINQYPDFNWIDRNISNKAIFKSKINLGISVRGNVIPELAYHGIKPLAAGENISQSFSYVFTPKNIKEYFNFIEKNIHKNFRKEMMFYRKDIYKLTYMSLIYNMNTKNYLSKKFDIKSINFTNSKSLIEFMKIYRSINN